MRIADSKYGTVIYGKVLRLKPGSGAAASKLIILSVAEVNCRGQETGKVIKVLCWNSDKNEWGNFADKARKFVPGQIITARVKFDVGDPDKATVLEMKKQGIYKLITKDEQEQIVLCGKIAKTVSSKNFFGAYIPIDRYIDHERQTQWYLVSFFGSAANIQKNFLGKGDMLFANGTIKEVTLNGYTFLQFIPGFIKSISTF